LFSNKASVIKNVAEAPTKELVTLPLVIVFEGMMVKDRESRQRARENRSKGDRKKRQGEQAESKGKNRSKGDRKKRQGEHAESRSKEDRKQGSKADRQQGGE
jgi:hypothetical protein